MASQTGQEDPFVIRDLLAKPKTFAFAQAVRLLALAMRKARPGDADSLGRFLRIRPELSLAHPGTDIAALEDLRKVDLCKDDLRKDQKDTTKGPLFRLAVTFLSLYGASSPLPTFYTEELIEEARADESASRDFLDIFNQAVYTLYYRACNNSKLGLRSLEQNDQSLLNLQYSLLGMGLEGLRQNARTQFVDLAHIGLFSQHNCTAASLAAYVANRSGAPAISVEQCVPRRIKIPPEQRARLGQPAQSGLPVPTLVGGARLLAGSAQRPETMPMPAMSAADQLARDSRLPGRARKIRPAPVSAGSGSSGILSDLARPLGSVPACYLGRNGRGGKQGCPARLGDAVLGKSIADQQGGFDLHVHDLDTDNLERFIPGGEGRQQIEDAARRYLTSPLAWNLVLHLQPGARKPARLGQARLGGNAFLASANDDQASVYRWYRS